MVIEVAEHVRLELRREPDRALPQMPRSRTACGRLGLGRGDSFSRPRCRPPPRFAWKSTRRGGRGCSACERPPVPGPIRVAAPSRPNSGAIRVGRVADRQNGVGEGGVCLAEGGVAHCLRVIRCALARRHIRIVNRVGRSSSTQNRCGYGCQSKLPHKSSFEWVSPKQPSQRAGSTQSRRKRISPKFFQNAVRGSVRRACKKRGVSTGRPRRRVRALP
jgi:hypothetical protein